MQPVDSRSRSAARSMNETSVPMESGMPRSARPRRMRSSGVRQPELLIYEPREPLATDLGPLVGSRQERSVVRAPQARQRQVKRRTTRRRWYSLITWSFSWSSTSATSSA